MSQKSEPKDIVFRVEEGMDPREILCTTYQMRNFYRQFADGYFSKLDVMNYMQHHVAAKLCKRGDSVLDVCCGRALMLPLLSYIRPDIDEYIGIDICKSNMKEAARNKGACQKLTGFWKDAYTFRITLLECNVAEMSKKFSATKRFGTIIYTASIEHMQKEAAIQSLRECWKLLEIGGTMLLTTPNTKREKDEDGYTRRYKAHLYEWNLEEMRDELVRQGFAIKNTFGLVADTEEFEEGLSKYPEALEVYNKYKEYMPGEWLLSFFPVIYPEIASEVAFVCEKDISRQKDYEEEMKRWRESQ